MAAKKLKWTYKLKYSYKIWMRNSKEKKKKLKKLMNHFTMIKEEYDTQ